MLISYEFLKQSMFVPLSAKSEHWLLSKTELD